MTRYHKNSDIKSTLILNNVSLSETVNFYIIVIDPKSNQLKQMSLNPELGFNSDDISEIDDSTVEVKIHRAEIATWEFGKYFYQLRASYTNVGFEDSVRVDSNSEKAFRLIADYEKTGGDPSVTANLPCKGIPEAPVDGNGYLRKDAGWEQTGAGTGDMLSANNLSDVDDVPESKENLELGNVDNTSDADKTISDATAIALDGKEPAKGVDDNYVTDAEKTVIGNTSGSNTGDQNIPVEGVDFDPVGTDNSDNNAANTNYADDYRATNFVSGTDYEPAKGADDNYVTDAEKTVIGNTSGSNSGDQSAADVPVADAGSLFTGTELEAVTQELGQTRVDIQIHGFVDNTKTSVSFNPSTYEFTLTDLGTGWSYYRDGIKHTISGTQTTTLAGSPPSADVYFIVIDNITGTLSNSTTSWNLEDSKVVVGAVIWNDALTPKFRLTDERHTIRFNKIEHQYEHDTYGTRLGSSGAISGYTIDSDVDADKQYNVAQSVIWDEDLPKILASITGGTDNYHIGYRTGASTWVWKQTAMPFDYTGSGYINYDLNGTMTEGQGNRWYNTFIVATNEDGLSRFTVVHGQAEFSTLAGAKAETPSSLTLTGLGISEGVFIWQMIWRTSAGFSSTGQCELDVDPIPLKTNITTAIAPSGLGTMSVQDADDVAISGGIITGITDLAIENGGTGQSTAQAAIDVLTAVSGATNEYVLTKDTLTGNAVFKVSVASVLTVNTIVEKETTTSFADFQTALNLLPRNLGGYILTIRFLDDSHAQASDLILNFYNGWIYLVAETQLSAPGTGQNVTITPSGTSQIIIRGNANIKVGSIKFTTVTGANQTHPIATYGNFILKEEYTHHNHAASSVATGAYYNDGCKIISDGCTLSKGSADAVFMEVVTTRANGSSLEIHNSEVSGTEFTAAAKGNCMADFGTTNAGFLDKVINGAIERTANDGGGTSKTDITAYSLTSITDDGATINITSNRVGTAYYALYTDGSAVPTIANIIAGTGTGYLDGANIAVVTAGVSVNDAITGLDPETTYDIYMVALDSLDNESDKEYIELITEAVADTTPPTLLSATIEDAAPTNVVMVFDEVVNGTNLGFSLSGTTSTVFTSISGSGTDTITGVLATAAENGETILFSYDSGTGDIVDDADNALASITDEAVVNNVLGAYSTEYQAVYDAMTTKPSSVNAGYQDALVSALVAGGYWARMIYLNIYANEYNSAGEALINWMNPGTNDATNVSATAWTQYQGFSGDGVADYINTNINPSTDGQGIYTLNDAACGIYLRTPSIQESGFVYGSRLTSADEMNLMVDDGGGGGAEIHGGSLTIWPGAGNRSDGLFIITRTGASVVESFRNGASTNTGTPSSTGVPNADMYVLNRSGAAGYSTNQASIFFMMDGVNGTDAAAINTIYETYMDAIGTGVQ